MKTIRVSATDARNNFFNLLNQVMYENLQVIIGKAGTDREVVLKEKTSSKEEYEKTMKVLRGTYGALKNTPASRLTDDRLRGKRAREYLKKIRKAW
jgi:prevent-host-death family protein